VTAIVPSWNRRERLLDCVGSLLGSDHMPLDVVVVDNASTDGSVEALRRAHPKVRVIVHRENRGFTGGVNRGLEEARQAGSRYAFLLNDDAVVASDCVRLLVDTAEAENASVVGPSIYFAMPSDVLWSAGGRVDWRRARPEMLGAGEADRGQFGQGARDVEFLPGCALLIRLDVVAEVGSFDSRFFAYYEDVEWGARVRAAGHRVLHEPRAHVWHDIDLERQEASPQHLYYMRRNRLLWLESVGASRWVRARVAFADDLRTAVAWSVLPRWRHRRPLGRVVLRALVDYYRGRYGESPF